MRIDPLPTPSSSDAIAFPAVELAAFGFGPCVIAFVKLKLPVEDPDSVSSTRNSRVSAPNRSVWAPRMRVFSTANRWFSNAGLRVSPWPGAPRL